MRTSFNDEKITHDKPRWRRGQILTLKNDPSCSMAPRVVMKYILNWDKVGGQILTLKNDPTCYFAPRIVTIYKLHWYEMGSNFIVEK